MDWNAFFATIAQITATIVAIWGAFIISKILNNETAFNNKKAKIRSVWNISHALGMRSLMNFKGYNYSKRYASLSKLKELLPETEILSANQYYLNLDFSWYDCREDVLDLLTKVIGDGKDKTYISQIIDIELEALKEFNYSNHQRESLGIAIQSKYVEVYENTSTVYFLLKLIRNNPESSNMITWSIIILSILFCVGIIYPVSFIPTNLDYSFSLKELNNVLSFSHFFTILFSLKGLIIFSIVVPFYSLLTYFFIKNLKLKYKPKNIEILEEYEKMDTYNIHFKNFNENAKYFEKKYDEKNCH